MSTFDYSVLPGLFAQAEASTTQSSFDFLQDNFGLLRGISPSATGSTADEPAARLTDWQTLTRRIQALNLNAVPGTSYKVLFVARHGISWHNVAEQKYGTDVWNEYYSKLDGSDGVQWFDARLTPDGERQADNVATYWARQHRTQGMPVPESFYCSPLIRCLQTARMTHAGPQWGPGGSERYRPVIKEQLRETNGVHTCDRRSPRRVISVRFPEVDFEAGFSQEDELWSGEQRETAEQQERRVRQCVDEIFATDNNAWISVTAHSGTSRALMKVLGFPRDWRLGAGEVVPIAVKACRRRVVDKEE